MDTDLKDFAELQAKLDHAEKCCAEMREEVAGLRRGAKIALKNWQWQERCLKDAIDKSAEEIKRLREALRKIADIGQLTNVTFEVQAFTAMDIALAAMKEDA